MKRWIIAPVALMLLSGSFDAMAVTDDGTCLTQDGVPATRVKSCTTLLKDAPPGERRFKLLYARADAYYRVKSYLPALADLQEMKAVAPNEPNVHFYIAMTYNALNYYALALPEIEEAMRLGLRAAAAYQVRGMDYVSLGRYGEGLQDAEMAITSNPNVSEGYFLRGYANLETGEIERAIQDLDQAVRANPDDVMTHSLRGRAHFALDQYDAALADFETASRLAPDHPETELENDVRAMMAQTPAPVAAKDADPNGAMPSRAVGHTHNCSAYYPYLSNAIGEAGDVLVSYDVGADGAIADVAIRKTSGFERLDRAAVICVSKHWRNLPATLKGVGVASANHEAIIRYIAYVSDTASSIKHRGLTLAGIGDFNGAIVQFDQWIAAQPGSSDAYFNRGLAELALQRNDDAQRDFGDAAKLDPKNDNAIAGRDMARAATLKPLPRNGGI